MKKLRYIFASLLAIAFVATSCQDDDASFGISMIWSFDNDGWRPLATRWWQPLVAIASSLALAAGVAGALFAGGGDQQ